MIFGRRWSLCSLCGGKHELDACPESDVETPKRVPIETPGHSGPYQGPAPVRVLPPGVCGEKDKRGHEYVYQQRAANRAKQRADRSRA